MSTATLETPAPARPAATAATAPAGGVATAAGRRVGGRLAARLAELPAEPPTDTARIAMTVVGTLAGLLAFAVLVGLVVLSNINRGTGARPVTPDAAGGPVSAQPAAVDPAEYRNEQIEKLHGYSWLDKSRGTVLLPVEEGARRYVAEQRARAASAAAESEAEAGKGGEVKP